MNIARGFVHAYPALLLDEPTASLDPANRETVLALIGEAKARGAAIVGIFHDADARARVADREVDVSAFAPRRRGAGMRGTFIAVVGPSGSGKDTLIREAVARRPDLVAARRVVSRPAHDATEIFDSVNPAEFACRRAAGLFALDWQAHGLSYGIPAAVGQAMEAERHVLANLSRAAIPAARSRFRPFRALVVTAPAAVLASRLAARGREDADAIRVRLERAGYAPPQGPDVVVIDNGGALEDGIAAFLDALPGQPVSG